MERFTEEKLKNGKFRNSETAIRRALFLNKNKLSVKRLIKTAHISRATLYRHHQNINEIIPDYEKYILKCFQKTVCRPAKNKNTKLRIVYERLLLFTLSYQEIISCILKYDSSNLIETMLLSLEPTISITLNLKNQEVCRIYTKEVAYIIEEWQQNGFKKEEISVTLDKISYLTSTAHSRLSPLKSFE